MHLQKIYDLVDCNISWNNHLTVRKMPGPQTVV